MSRARWLFVRAYLLVVLLVLVIGLGLESLLEQRDEQAWSEREITLVQGGFRYAEEQLALDKLRHLMPDSPEFSARLSQQLEMPAQLLPLADFSVLGKDFERLQQGEILQLFDTSDRAVFHGRLASSEWVLALGPAPAPDNDRAQWVVPLFYSLIALAVFIWIRPLTRDLEQLQGAALAFGRQNFSNRVTIPGGSWLQPVAEAFNGMAQRIEWLLQSHRELTHAVSHELRTPLARLRFSLEMLAGASSEDRARHLESMNRDIEELNSLVEEMLGYAELEQSNLSAQLKLLELGPWLAEYCYHYNSREPTIPISFEPVGEKLPVLADERLITRALDNLVGNAQRFAASRIEVRCAFSGGRAQLRVSDDGPGIPAEKRQAALAAYVRLDEEEQAPRKGFGLGLAIVKRVMDLHRGAVVIDSGPAGGAEISLCWPSVPS